MAFAEARENYTHIMSRISISVHYESFTKGEGISTYIYKKRKIKHIKPKRRRKEEHCKNYGEVWEDRRR